MNEELEKAISRKKKEISDYVRIAKSLHIEEAEIQKRVDLLLGDLSRLLRMRKYNSPPLRGRLKTNQK